MTMERDEGLPPVVEEQPGKDAGPEFLLAYLRANDAACPLCQYNLRNLTEPRCPECGREIRLTVGMVEPYLLPWVMTTVFVAMAAGVGAVFWFVVMVEGPPPIHDIRAEALVPLGGVCYGVLAMPLTLMLIVGRRVFWRLP